MEDIIIKTPKFQNNQFLQALLVILGLWLAWKLHLILILLFVAFMFTVILQPFVRMLQKVHMPAAFAILLPVLTVLGLIIGLSYYVAPPLAGRASEFASSLPEYLDNLPSPAGIDISEDSIRDFATERFGTIGELAFRATTFIAEAIIAILTIFVVTIYWLSSYGEIKDTWLSFIPKSYRSRAADIWKRLEIKLNYWFRAQLLLSLAVGLLTWIALLILGLPFAEVLAIIAALLEIIPTIGPIVAAVPAIAIGFSMSATTGLFVVLAYVIIQQIENNLLAPLLMGKTVRLHPIVIIVSLLVGATLLGIIGALLAVPFALVISSIVDSYRNEPLND